MKPDLVNSICLGYRSLLRFYPHHFREEFGEEMVDVFRQRLESAAAGSALAVVTVCLREVRDAPYALASAYRFDWPKKWQEGIQLLREATSTTGLPPPPPDGRQSWRQVGPELSLFLIGGLLLLWLTYLRLDGPSPGWQRDLELLGKVITPLTLPVFLVGLARGLPRWVYPFGGLLLVYQALRANQSGLWPFLAVLLLAYTILAMAALVTNPHRSTLPVSLRRIGQSLALDYTRLSFAVYGAAPLAIIMAFDDGHTNSQTPYLALSVLAMVAGALIYCRSSQSRVQVGALAGGMTLIFVAAWLDHFAFASSSGIWIVAPVSRHAEIISMLGLWIPWVALILAPALLWVAGRAVRPKRAIHVGG